MNLVLEALAWIGNPETWQGSPSLATRTAEQLGYTFGALAIAAVFALPAGLAIGHTGRGRDIVVALSGGLRALPSLGLIIALALAIGLGFQAPLIAFVILAVPPILAGAYAGVEAIDRATIDAARSVGMTEWQILTKVEIPLALPLIIGGLRSGALQVIATATLAYFATGGGLGVYIDLGLATRNYVIMLGASIVVTALALLLEGMFSALQRLAVPRGVTASGRRDSDSNRSRSSTAPQVPLHEGN